MDINFIQWVKTQYYQFILLLKSSCGHQALLQVEFFWQAPILSWVYKF